MGFYYKANRETFGHIYVHPLSLGANIYGLASCLAFLKVIFYFEIHYRFGPVFFCIRSVVWDIMSIIGSFLIAVVAFGVGLVSVFGIYKDMGAFEHFDDFHSTFKSLFWIIFDPGKEEYSDIEEDGEEGNVACGKQNAISTASAVATNITLGVGRYLRSVFSDDFFNNNTKTDDDPNYNSFAKRKDEKTLDLYQDIAYTAERIRNASVEEGDKMVAMELSHKFGIYLWGMYQVLYLLK